MLYQFYINIFFDEVKALKIAVVDAKGAGLGQTIIKRIKKEISKEVFIIALGTNTLATSNMVRSGANVGISGEKAICSFLKTGEIAAIIGPIGILLSGSIEGEITMNIANAVYEKQCKKYILPLKMHGIYIPGTQELQIKDFIDEILKDINNS